MSRGRARLTLEPVSPHSTGRLSLWISSARLGDYIVENADRFQEALLVHLLLSLGALGIAMLVFIPLGCSRRWEAS